MKNHKNSWLPDILEGQKDVNLGKKEEEVEEEKPMAASLSFRRTN